MNIIEVKDIYKTFGKREGVVRALNGVNLSVKQDEMVAIMGKSGSGKSTLLNILGGMMSFDKGEYYCDGELVDFKSQRKLTGFRRDKVGFVVQYFALVDELNVFQNVALPLKYQGYSRGKMKKEVLAALTELGIADKAKAYPTELSGGQQQRVAIARAIVKKPDIILADEPTGALDERTGEEVISILRRLNEGGRTVIVVTHDLKVAESCDRIVYIKDGVACEDCK